MPGSQGFGFDRVTVGSSPSHAGPSRRLRPSPSSSWALDLRVPVFGAVGADEPSAAYAAIHGEGRLLELPVFRPDLHYGSVYLGYARQSPRERPQGYSTLAPPAADRLARDLRGLSCGRGEIPPGLGIRFVAVHRGLYDQSGFFGDRVRRPGRDDAPCSGLAPPRPRRAIATYAR